MKATIKTNNQNIAYFGNKECISSMKAVGVFGGEIRTLCEARLYMGHSRTASVVYCNIWVHGEHSTSGSAKAGGYGYHKESAALGAAIRSSGIELDSSIDGVGERAMNEAMLAIAREAFPGAALITTI